MNKNLYRIIFSKARNMFIAVGENSKSQTKAAGEGTQASVPLESQDNVALHQHWVVKSLVASISLWMPLAPVYAQIQADPSANVANRPVIGVGVNNQGQNVPVVNIQTPVNGVSHNIYKQMDVLNNGVVLNNSRTGAGSVIVGSVGANPFLAKSEARLILNEINSTAATRFEGNLEVAGQRADVIIANPAGINIKGGGFINANKAIFTTGKPQLNADGSLQQFVVDQGKVTVSANAGSNLGLGGNNNNADYVDIYARALELNAQLHANQDLNVITGANTISASLENIESKTSTAPAPALAVDIKSLGGMYANNIYLMGSEKGLGVSNAGTLKVVNNLVVTSAGKIENSGTLQSTSTIQSVVSVQTTETGTNGNISSSGLINGKGVLSIDSANDLNINGNQVLVDNGIVSPLMLSAQGDINIASTAQVRNLGINTTAGQGDTYLDAKNISVEDKSTISSTGDISLNATENITTGKATALTAGKDINFATKNKITATETNLTAISGNINLQTTNSDLMQSNTSLNATTLNAGKDLNLYSSGDLNLTDLNFTLTNGSSAVKNINGYSGRNLVWNNIAKALPQITGKVALNAGNNLTLSVTGLSSKDSIQLQANQLTLNSALTSQKDISLTSEVADLALNNAINAQNDINITALAGGISANNFQAVSTVGKVAILAKNDVALKSNQTIDSTDFDVKKTTNFTTINGNNGIIIGSLENGKVNFSSVNLKTIDGDIHILSNNGINFDSNMDSDYGSPPDYNLEIQPVKNNLTSNNIFIENNKSLTSIHYTSLDAKGNIEVYSKDDLSITGVDSKSQYHTAISSDGDISNNSLSNTFTSSGLLSLISKKGLNGSFNFTGGSVLIEVDNIFDTSHIFAKTISSDLLNNESTLNDLNGDLTIQTNQSLTFNKTKINSAGDLNLISKNGALTVIGFDNSPYAKNLSDLSEFYAGGSLLFEGASVQLSGAKINAKKDIHIISTQNDLILDGASLWHDEATDYFSYKRSMVDNDQEKADFLSTWVTGGVENFNTQLTSLEGIINLASKKGLSITGSDINAKQGSVHIQAQGVLDELYKPTAVKAGSMPKVMQASILIDGNIDAYGKGKESDPNYSYREYVNPTNINGETGVNIRAMGTSVNDNIILQGVGITSNQGDVNIEANKNILFDVALETLYDRSTKKETKRSWYGKKKIITTTSIGDVVTPASVDIYGKNINVVSSFKNPAGSDGTRDPNLDTSIDIYSARFNANGGKVSIQSGGDLNFLTVSAINNSNVNTVKKSSWLGINLGTSKTNATRNQTTQLPAQLKADYIETKSGYDTRLDGTEFNYLKTANIQAGGTITLNAVIDRVDETLKREKTSAIWQSIQDKGSVSETAKLPQFNGPVLPTFKAAGGLSVQVPVKDDLRSALETIVSQQGTAYLKDLTLRNDVDWQAVKLAQAEWDYKSQGLTPAAAALIVIIITVVTYGYGASGAGAALLNTSTATTNAMANAAVASMASQAAISLINNGGDPLEALKSLGDSNYIKSLAVSVLTAGALNAVGGTAMMENIQQLQQSGEFVQSVVGNTAQVLVNSAISTAIDTGINGGSLSEALEGYLLSGAMGTIQGTLAQNIKSLESQNFSIEYVLHKVAHAAAGCVSAAIGQKSCEAGAIGAAVGEVMAEYLRNPKVFNSVDDAITYKNQIVEVSKGIAGAVAVVTGYDENTAMASATNALNNNFVFLAALPAAGEAVLGLTLGAIRACATNPACISRATQLGISITATLAANSNSNDDKKVVIPVLNTSGSSTGTPAPPDPEDTTKTKSETVYANKTVLENVTSKGTRIESVPNGTREMALNDLKALGVTEVRTIQTSKGELIMGRFADGGIAKLRRDTLWQS